MAGWPCGQLSRPKRAVRQRSDQRDEATALTAYGIHRGASCQPPRLLEISSSLDQRFVGAIDEARQRVVGLQVGKPDAQRARLVATAKDRIDLVETRFHSRHGNSGDRTEELVSAVPHDRFV